MKNLTSEGRNIYLFVNTPKGLKSRQPFSKEIFYTLKCPDYTMDNPVFEDFYQKVSFKIMGVYIGGGFHLGLYSNGKKVKTSSSDNVYQDIDSIKEVLGENYIQKWEEKRLEKYWEYYNYEKSKEEEHRKEKDKLFTTIQLLGK